MFADHLEGLREIVNHGTATLAVTGMLDQYITQGFSWALKTTAANVYSKFQGGVEGVPDDGPQEFDDVVGDDEEHNAIRIVPMQIRDNVTSSNNFNQIMMFCYAFVVAPLNTTRVGEDHFAVVCAVATFNLGLAMHLQSFVEEKVEDSSRLIAQAEEFYSQTYELINRFQLLHPEGTCIQLYLAVCNNLAELFTQCGELEEASAWQDKLRDSIVVVPPAMHSPVYQHFSTVSICYGIDFAPFII